MAKSSYLREIIDHEIGFGRRPTSLPFENEQRNETLATVSEFPTANGFLSESEIWKNALQLAILAANKAK